MNVSRLNRLVEILTAEIKRMAVVGVLDEMYDALSGAFNEPSKETTKAFRDKFGEFQALQEASVTETLPPSFKRGIAELGLQKYFGKESVTALKNIVERSGKLPDEILKSFDSYRSQAKKKYDVIAQVDHGLSVLGADYDKLEEGEFEFGLVIPDENTPSALGTFKKEVQKLEKAMRAFQELVGSDPDGAKIRSISASDWTFFVEISPEAAAAIAFAIERIVALYKNLLEIRVLKKQAQIVPNGEEIVRLIQQKVDEKTEAGLREIATSLIERQKISTPSRNGDSADGRNNELENHFSSIVKWLAKHIETGSVVEVRAEPLPAPDIGAEDEARHTLRQLIETINESTQAVLTADVDAEVQIFPALETDDGRLDNLEEDAVIA